MGTDNTSRLIPVMAGKTCAGFLLRRGREGVEAFDRDEHSLGLFTDPIAAAAAVEKSGTSRHAD
jgi:hypothetical protein